MDSHFKRDDKSDSLYGRWGSVLLLIALSVIAAVLITAPIDPQEGEVPASHDTNRDVLVYTVSNSSETSLLLYDSEKHESIPVVTGVDSRYFSFSADGRIAFTSREEGSYDIYLVETQPTPGIPTPIIDSPATDDYALAWSPDGRYLAFQSVHDTWIEQLYVWDGEQVINVTPDNLQKIEISPEILLDWVGFFGVSWSPDGYLVFTVSYVLDHPGEIYLWDGITTTNLSQNPAGEDCCPSWSSDGRLAFLSGRDGEYDILIWDGVSFKDGQPDRSTFTNAAPGLTEYFSLPTWTNTGLLSFKTVPPNEHHAQVYIWDGQMATDISQNPDMHNTNQTWADNGNWAFATFFSSQQLLYIRDDENQPLLTVEGQYSPAWSSDGNLIFCQPLFNQSGWILSLWDGQQVIKVAEGAEIWAQWQSGQGVGCTNG